MKRKNKQVDYVVDYKKNHYRRFVADLKFNEWDELEENLKKYNITKAQFIRNAISNINNFKK